MYNSNILSHSATSLLTLFMIFLNKINSVNFFLMASGFPILFTKTFSPKNIFLKDSCIFPSNTCVDLIFMFRALFHLEVTFVYVMSPDGEPVVPVPFPEQSTL